MNFELNEDQSAFQDAARSFMEAELLPHAARWDEEHIFPIEALRKAAEQGFAGIYVRGDVGGSALTRLDAAIIFEELAAADPSTAAYISIHNMASWMIDAFANEELRHRYLPKLTRMEHFGSYCLTEPGSFSSHARRSRWRPVRPERREGVHLRRRRQRRLCLYGSNGRAGPERRFVHRRREGLARPFLRQAGEEAGVEQPADRCRDLRKLPRPDRQSRRKRGRRLQDRDEGA